MYAGREGGGADLGAARAIGLANSSSRRALISYGPGCNRQNPICMEPRKGKARAVAWLYRYFSRNSCCKRFNKLMVFINNDLQQILGKRLPFNNVNLANPCETWINVKRAFEPLKTGTPPEAQPFVNEWFVTRRVNGGAVGNSSGSEACLFYHVSTHLFRI